MQSNFLLGLSGCWDSEWLINGVIGYHCSLEILIDYLHCCIVGNHSEASAIECIQIGSPIDCKWIGDESDISQSNQYLTEHIRGNPLISVNGYTAFGIGMLHESQLNAYLCIILNSTWSEY